MENKNLKTEFMPVVAIRGLVLYPKMALNFDLGRSKSINAINFSMKNGRKVFLVAQKDSKVDEPKQSDLYTVGTVAEVKQTAKVNGGLRVLVEGIYRAKMINFSQDERMLSAEVKEYPMNKGSRASKEYLDALVRTIKAQFGEYIQFAPKMPTDFSVSVFMENDASFLSECIAGNLPISSEDKQEILECSSVPGRLERIVKILESENKLLQIEQDIFNKVSDSVDKNQREYYLREQMKVISDELGEDDSTLEEADEFEKKIKNLHLEKEWEEKLLKEVNRMAKMPSSSPECAVIRTYLDEVIDLPWNKKTEINTDITKARKILDADHYGMVKVKERIIESVAVSKLAPNQKGQIICLVGPPGVGKTSVAKSIAKATGRKYARVSLGGVRDESDIRGHRKTYIGSMPGRIIDALKQAKSKNALILLDEVDKLGNDFKGDPSSALLEVLDSAQNNTFRDHYIEIPFDLSEVLFITTANVSDNIPDPLFDRLEIIELPSYTREEKFKIAKKYLMPKERKASGLDAKTVKLNDEALYFLIDCYTKEAGVRSLDRNIASLYRKAATKIVENKIENLTINKETITEMLGTQKFFRDSLEKVNQVGVVNGLAWTSVGGELLQVEVAVMEGTGKIELTGSLGDVMKESAQAAVSYLRANSKKYSLSETFYKDKDIHVHVPEGAVPKDGPSAGVTITTAILSALSGKKVKHNIAMTGEITLRGRVLPIGGLREKSMAAYRNKLDTVIIPWENKSDLDEIDQVVKDNIKFIPVKTIDEVFENAYED